MEAWPKLFCASISKCPYLCLLTLVTSALKLASHFLYKHLNGDKWTLLHHGVTHPWNPNSARIKVLMRHCSATLTILISIMWPFNNDNPVRLIHISLSLAHLFLHLQWTMTSKYKKEYTVRLTEKWFHDHTNWCSVYFLIAFNVRSFCLSAEVHFVFSSDMWLKGGLYLL